MHTIDRSWPREKRGKGCVCARGKKDFFFFFFFFLNKRYQCHCVYWVRVGCNVMPVCLGCHCLVACIGRRSDSRCVSCNRPWMPVDFQSIPQHRHWSQPPPSSAESSESRSKHDWTHRVGSRRRLVLETACSDPPTDAQRNRNAHALSCTNFAAILGAGQLVAMVARGWAWLTARILGCALWIRSERDNHDCTFFNSTEWQLLSSLTALATSTSLESTAKEPWTDRKTTIASTVVLHQRYYTEYYTTLWRWRLLLIGRGRCKKRVSLKGFIVSLSEIAGGPGVAGLINYKWGTPDDLYTHDLYSAIVDRIASKLALCFGILFSYQHTKTKRAEIYAG